VKPVDRQKKHATQHASYPQWIHTLQHTPDAAQVGNKAFNLYRLQSLGFNTPATLALIAFDEQCTDCRDDSDYLHAIDEFHQHLPTLLPSRHGWAVRSSATIEDLAEQSQAGRFETVFIEHPQQLKQAVAQVWASATLADINNRSMGVVLQPLIKADIAGVGFSVDPISQKPITLLELCEGNAAQLVDGTVSPLTLRLDHNAVARDAYGETIALPEGISQAVITELNTGIRELADYFKAPVDVEWALKEGQLFWLQVRPMTHRTPPLFAVPSQQRKALSGLWVRMQHCFSPQMPLVVSMNPGGYFNFNQWDSQLVNGFHYIKMKPKDNSTIDECCYNEILDRWDNTEKHYYPQLEQCLSASLNTHNNRQLWHVLQARIAIKRAVYQAYMDADFLTVRQQLQERIQRTLKKFNANESTPACLLSHLNSLSEQKQRALQQLAQLPNMTRETLPGTPQWHHFITHFGFESASSQLFYLPTLAETPTLLLDIIDSLKENKDTSSSQALLSEHSPPHWKEEADRICKQLSTTEASAFLGALQQWRRCIKRTEDDDYLLQKATAAVRYALLAIGEQLAANAQLNIRDDVFFLTDTELSTLLLTPLSTTTALTKTIAKRQQIFHQQTQLTPPAMIVNGRPMTPKTVAADGKLRGLGASPGIASGPVIIINDPFSCHTQRLPKNAIIVAPLLSPAFAYSLLGCAALITEIGGLASHGAIIAREMGIPAVVGVKGAREHVRTGMQVTVDGTSGEVILPDKALTC